MLPCCNGKIQQGEREKPGSNAEVDYVVQFGADIVPIEVKSATRGSMQSMFQFLTEKKYTYDIRCSMENFGTYQNVKIYPLYAASQIGNRNPAYQFVSKQE